MKLTAVLLLALGMGQAWGQKEPACTKHTVKFEPAVIQEILRPCNDPKVTKDEPCWSVPEPIDVPAIQKGRDCDMDPPMICGREFCTIEETDRACKGRWITRWTCADKTRILEHDENTPTKYYCRRPQL